MNTITTGVTLLVAQKAAHKLAKEQKGLLYDENFSIIAKSDKKFTTPDGNFLFHRLFSGQDTDIFKVIRAMDKITMLLKPDEYTAVIDGTETVIRGKLRDPIFTLDSLIKMSEQGSTETITKDEDGDDDETFLDMINSFSERIRIAPSELDDNAIQYILVETWDCEEEEYVGSDYTLEEAKKIRDGLTKAIEFTERVNHFKGMK